MRTSRSGKRFAVFASKLGFSRGCKPLFKAVNNNYRYPAPVGPRLGTFNYSL